MKRAAGTFLVALLLIAFSASEASAWPLRSGFHRGAVHRVFPHRALPRFPSRTIVIGRPWWGSTYWFAPGWGFAYGAPYPYFFEDDYDAFYAPYMYPPAPLVLAAPRKAYWYYCASADEYYPKVRTCPGSLDQSSVDSGMDSHLQARRQLFQQLVAE